MSDEVPGRANLSLADDEIAQMARAVGVFSAADEQGLPRRVKELIAGAVLAFRGDPAVEVHIRASLEAGASLEEVAEAFQAVIVPGGFPCLHLVLPILQRVESEIGDDLRPPEVSPYSTGRGTTMISWDWWTERYGHFDDTRNALSSLVYSPAGPVLAVKYRELIATAILSYRGYPNLDNHVARALKEGAMPREVMDAVQTAAVFGGSCLLQFAIPYLIEAGVLDDDGVTLAG